ncbi:RNA polymerase sigma factor [Lewinella sp. 4G2]|uniref:RNA polymerase sigma factor n=1 Tax=Lewinella sp. 4G2 TaxID=1803372 RepID=UPI0007B4C142|nr:RNA polymerase sigma factor [Lewinella sp. 4G2]OAV44545.1 RNA polymerase subunit sigma-70 [Lewinella sp. 4G2]
MPANYDQHLPAILNGCLKGQRSSQHDLYKLYYGYGMSVAIRYVEEEAEALSIVNDSFMKVYKNLKKYDRTQPYKPWFRKIIVNTAINQLKRQKKYGMETGMDEAGDLADRENILSQIGYQELITLVQSLSASYRAVFNMYVIDGFRHEEIAKTLGISVSTSKSNLVRARRKLRELLQQQLSTTNA